MKTKLDFIDGIRGLAALMVVLYHARLISPITREDSLLLTMLLIPFKFGGSAVGVFIVLSGFLLMLPVANGEVLKGGATGFLRRRAGRICPPYYAALLLFAVVCLIPAFRTPLTAFLTPVTGGNFLAHVFFLQNLKAAWSAKIDSPMWTVATEVQIYLLFVFCLLPLCRRFGLIVTNAVGLMLGISLHFLLPELPAAPWYIGLFCFGMTAALYYKAERFESLRRTFPFGIIAATGYAVFLSSALYRVAKGQDMSDSYIWIVDLINGFLITCLIMFLALRGGKLRDFLETPLMKLLARFSYSLYLFHLPPLFWIASLAIGWHLSPVAMTLFVYLVATPIAIVLSYGAFWLVERHFLRSPSARLPAGAVV